MVFEIIDKKVKVKLSVDFWKYDVLRSECNRAKVSRDR
jgi:hypothetical protein